MNLGDFAAKGDASEVVQLVSMPFAYPESPSLGLTLLKHVMEKAGFTSTLSYFSLSFAKDISVPLYEQIAKQPGSSCLAGEWLFAQAVFGERRAEEDAEYFEQWLRGSILHGKTTVDRDAFASQVMELRETRVVPFLDQCRDRVLAGGDVRLVGFTSVFQQHIASLALAKWIKAADPRVFIVFGGANCQGSMGEETIRQFPWLDAVVKGEGEIVFPHVVRSLLDGVKADLPGVLVRQDLLAETTPGSFRPAAPRVKLDELPMPDYRDYLDQLVDNELTGSVMPRLLVETSRGCWWGAKHHCVFCGLDDATMPFRSKPAERVVKELAWVSGQTPGGDIMIADDILDPRYFTSLLPLLADSDAKPRLYWQIKANISKSQAALLKRAGVVHVQPGIESLSTQVLLLMDKGVSGMQNLRLLKWMEELGLTCHWNLLWGARGEAPTEYDRIYELIPAISHLRPPEWFGPIAILRYSPYQEDPTKFGIPNVRALPVYEFIYRLDKKVIESLAYYFEPCEGAERIPKHIEQLMIRVRRWRREYRTNALFRVRQGGHPGVFDNRPLLAPASFTVLDPVSTQLLDAATGVSLARLEECSADPDPARWRRRLDDLLEHQFIVEIDGKFLSLVIDLEEYAAESEADDTFFRNVKLELVHRVLEAVNLTCEVPGIPDG